MQNYIFLPFFNKKGGVGKAVHFTGFIKDYFNDSFPKIAAFFARENNLDIGEMEQILKLTEEELTKSKPEDDE